MPPKQVIDEESPFNPKNRSPYFGQFIRELEQIVEDDRNDV